MASVESHGHDAVVDHANQLIATTVTVVVAAAAVVATLVFAYRRRVFWPLLVLVAGFITFLLEPLFDHLYGLWFFTQGQWNAVVTYGVHIPVWLPVVYIPFYGAWTVYLVRRFGRGVTMRVIFLLYLASCLLAVLAEQFYINGFGLYAYQDNQPLVIFNYPVFVGFVNGLPPFLAAMVYHRLLPLLRGWASLAILSVVPICFAADSFGTGFLYLAARHSGEHLSMVLLTVLALLSVAEAMGVVWFGARLAGLDRQTAPSKSVAAQTVT